MNYIVYKRYHGRSFSGEVNLPFNTSLTSSNGIIYYDESPICFEKSQVAHQYLSINDDEQGVRRGYLVNSIKKKLRKNSEEWDKIWEDPLCLKYKRTEHEDYFLWSHEFYIAPIEDLEYIAKLINLKL